MAFQRYIYTLTDVEIAFQVNGTPFQQGCLIAYFYPLYPSTAPPPTPWTATACKQICYLRPNSNTTNSLTIPFKFYRSVLNTYAGGLGEETLGAVFLQVLSPLTSLATSESISITMYSKFNSKFAIARPIPTTDFLTGRTKSFAKGVTTRATGLPPVAEFQAEGVSHSKQEVQNNYTYEIGSIVGDMPIQSGATTSSSTSAEGQLDMKIPMDNPPISGGTIPVAYAFGSMSKSNGVEVTTSMQFHQKMMHREPDHMMDAQESKIAFLMNQRGFLRNFSWSTTDVEETVLLTIPLNSVLRDLDNGVFTAPIPAPANIGLLNFFKFWRADIIFDFLCVRTMYQSGRLCATTAYGAPPSEVNATNKNLFLNHVM
jgi:hypothetical protein